MPGRLRDPRPGALPGTPPGASAASAGGTAPADDYDGWTLAELRRTAATRAVPGRSGMRRAELIDALRAADQHTAR
ncbi:hypothetical protein AGMMS50218_06590 [Actinomycetota bacterium]|nr:hypothetical protein AGMMS50218_06590 [Actinomycetota bacterium]